MADIISSTTQQFLDIHDITNNFVIMKDGTVSVILTVDAMNFGLLAEEEQDAVMYAYAGLLNSLNYPVQIVINSQTKDVTSYLLLLKDQESAASNETIRRRIRQYREFVGNLIHDRNVLDKKFYVVIPANSIELGFSGAKSVLPGQGNKFDISSIERSMLLEKAQNILDPRRDHMIAQFARIGLFSRQLSTQEIIQLFYIRYNPEAAEGQQIGESSSYASPLVQASIQGNTMNTDTTVPPMVGSAPTTPQAPVQPVVPAAPTQELPVAPPDTNTNSGMGDVVSEPPVTPPAGPVPTTPPTPAPKTPVAQPEMPTATTPNMSAPAQETPAQEVPATLPPVSPAPVQPMTSPATPSTESAPDASSIQADLDATVKQLGVTPPESTAVPPTEPTPASGNTTDQNQSNGDLPPLPEI